MNFLSRKLCMLVPCIMMLSSTYNVNSMDSMEGNNESINSQASENQSKQGVIEIVQKDETKNEISNTTNEEKQTSSINDLCYNMVADNDNNLQSKKRSKSINGQRKKQYQKSKESGKNNINDDVTNNCIIVKEHNGEEGKNAMFGNLDVISKVATMDVLAPEKEEQIIKLQENNNKPELLVANVDQFSYYGIKPKEEEYENNEEEEYENNEEEEYENNEVGESDGTKKEHKQNKQKLQIMSIDKIGLHSDIQLNKGEDDIQNMNEKIKQLEQEKEVLLNKMVDILSISNQRIEISDKKGAINYLVQNFEKQYDNNVKDEQAVANYIDNSSKIYNSVIFNSFFLKDSFIEYIKLSNELAILNSKIN